MHHIIAVIAGITLFVLGVRNPPIEPYLQMFAILGAAIAIAALIDGLAIIDDHKRR